MTITTINGGTIRDIGLRNINPSANLAGVPTIVRNLTIIFDNAGVDMPLTTLTGNLAVYAGGGPITQNDVITVAGTTFLAANANNIDLTNVANDFVGSVSMFTLATLNPHVSRLHNASITDSNDIDLGPSVIPDTVAAVLPANPFTDGSYSVDGFDHGDVSIDGHLTVVAVEGNISDSGLVLYYKGGTFQVQGGYSIIIDNNPLLRIYIQGSNATTLPIPENVLNVIFGTMQNLVQGVQIFFDPDYFFQQFNLFSLQDGGDASQPDEIRMIRILR